MNSFSNLNWNSISNSNSDHGVICLHAQMQSGIQMRLIDHHTQASLSNVCRLDYLLSGKERSFKGILENAASFRSSREKWWLQANIKRYDNWLDNWKSDSYCVIGILHGKCPNTEFFLLCIFPYLDWIRRFTLFSHSGIRDLCCSKRVDFAGIYF